MTLSPPRTPFTRAGRLERLDGLLRERILVLDGAMGTLLQRHQLSEEDFRGERFADHPKDLRGNNDLLASRSRTSCATSIGRTSPPAPTSCPPTRSPRRGSRRRTTGWPTSRGELNEAGARLAREAADEAEASDGQPRLRRRVAGADQPDRLHLPGRQRPRRPQRLVRGAGRGVPGGGRGPGARRRGHPVRRDGVRHAQRQGRDLRHRGGVRRARVPAPGRRLGDDRGRVRADAVGPDGRGVLGGHPPRAAAARGPQLRARGEAAPRARGGAGPDRRRAARRYPNAGLPNELGGYDETPEVTSAAARRVGAGGARQPGRVAAGRRPSTRPRSPRPSAASRRA